MTPPSLIFLSHDDVLRVQMTTEDVIARVEEALVERAERRTLMPPKVEVVVGPSQFFHGMPAVVQSAGAAGMKWLSYAPAAAAPSSPNSSALLILNDVDTGLPYAVLDALWLTYARTAACAALAIRHCGRRRTRTLTFVGGGVLPRSILPHLRVALPGLAEVRVVTRSVDTAERFRDEMQRRLDLTIRAYADVLEAVHGADVVISAVGHVERPPLKESALSVGMLALPMDGELAWESAAFYSADRVYADDADVFRKGFAARRPGQRVPAVTGELADVVAGVEPGRQNDDERIFVSNNGIAILDVVVGRELYLAAQRIGLGTRLESLPSIESLIRAFQQ